MKSLHCFRLAAFCFVATPLTFAAETASTARPAEVGVSANSLAGSYAGTWESGSDGGQLKIKLFQQEGAWKAEVSFTVGEARIPGKVASVNVTGQKLDLVVDWEVEATPGQSHITGELSGDKLEGIYDSKTPDGTSSGTWKVTRG